MKNLRINQIKIIDSTTIEAYFTEALTNNLNTSNVQIISKGAYPNPAITEIKINKNILEINCQPLTPFGLYEIIFVSTSARPFVSINGDAIIIENNIDNLRSIIGPELPDSPVKEFLVNYLNGSPYNLESGTVVNSLLQNYDKVMSKALYDIRQVKNENYLSETIIDEEKVRSNGPYDRLNEEGAYYVTRVGLTRTGTNTNKTIEYDSFPNHPITLNKTLVTEVLQIDSVDTVGVFNINSLVLNLSKKPVTTLTKLTFVLFSTPSIIEYDISTLGYQIKNSKYDPQRSYSLFTLENNQIKISDKILNNPNFNPIELVRVEVEYEYSNLGINVDVDSLEIYSIFPKVREVIPPIVNTFSLSQAPIVTVEGEIAVLNGVIFLDPNAIGTPHPAFKFELPFTQGTIPSSPGQYSIDYQTGTVYVYGADNLADGTGAFPPLASYLYKNIYTSQIDYVYDSLATDIESKNDLVALPKGSLIGEQSYIKFNYEEVLVPDIDYVAGIHQESLQERIENKLLSFNILQTKFSPVTNVFRIYNETSGEIYTINRWEDNKVYFNFVNPPKIVANTGERVIFETINNELLFVDTELFNSSNVRIFKIELNNNRITSSSEDTIGSSINTSLSFADGYIFQNEIWFDRSVSLNNNLDKLQVGTYTVDYNNGVIYCAVSNTQGFVIGTATYKHSKIIPSNSHVISVEDIYYRLSPLTIKSGQVPYQSFGENQIYPEKLEFSDEINFAQETGKNYQINNNSIGYFEQLSFNSNVTYSIKDIRSIHEFSDLTNNLYPINFNVDASFNNKSITVSSKTESFFANLLLDNDGYYVVFNRSLSYLSPNITRQISVKRISDNLELWNNAGVIETGEVTLLRLSGVNAPQINDFVEVVVTYTINNLSRVVVDYNKGEYYVDYTYLADEILVSYEYGDNILDFRRSESIAAGDTYYVSYKVGALRDALLRNFGSLVNIPILNSLDVNLPRERYRDALMAALSSFIQGPTITAIKNLGTGISHIEPEIIESIFQNWSLGNSLVSSKKVKVVGQPSIIPAKFDNGMLLQNSYVTFPMNSHLRLEEGSLSFWCVPQWDGIDNTSDLNIEIKRDGYFVPSNVVFIGANEVHPVVTRGSFIINKKDVLLGEPSKNKDGVFIYYASEPAGRFNRWYLEIIDGYVDGYHTYEVIVNSRGSFYDVQTLKDTNQFNIFTGVNKVRIKVNPNIPSNYKLTFICEEDHYLIDSAEKDNKNRFSVFKDASGYLNFKVIDQNSNNYQISADVSAWQSQDPHFISMSWKLNTKDAKDEMHLFVDGQEVPNIIKYGQKLQPYLHEKFRSVSNEEIIAPADKDIVGSVDLQVTSGSNIVSSSLNFSSYDIQTGDRLYIEEIGFDINGYVINTVNGNELILATAMPSTQANAKFTVNKTRYLVNSEIDIYKNIAVSRIPVLVEGNDLVGLNNSNVVSSSLDFIAEGVKPGYLIRIPGSNLPTTTTILQVNQYQLTLEDTLTSNLNAVPFYIYALNEQEISGVRALRPSYSIDKEDGYNYLTFRNNVFANDLLLLRTLGLNNRRIRESVYIWSDNLEHVIKTKLPSPIHLDEVKIFKNLVKNLIVNTTNSTNNSGTLTYTSTQIDQPSNAQLGRTLNVEIIGSNIDFSTPVTITISGIVNGVPNSETLIFSQVETKSTTKRFISVNNLQVIVKPLNVNRNALTLNIKEKYSLTVPEQSELVPVIKYSYQIKQGSTLSADGYTSWVTDGYQLFSAYDVGKALIIQSPASVAGFYLIEDISSDFKSIQISPTVPAFSVPLSAFSDGIYQIIDTTKARSGFQNGFFVLEQDVLSNTPYLLRRGWYDFDYHSYLSIKLTNTNLPIFIGTDIHQHKFANAIFDHLKSYYNILTDTRVGETISARQRSITKDFNSLRALEKDNNTLLLINFDSLDLSDVADTYARYDDKQYLQTSYRINDNFDDSLVCEHQALVLNNDGLLDTSREGTLEFWVSPLYDTYNDPHERFYFDAFGAVTEEMESSTLVSIKTNANIGKVLKVSTKNNPNEDYFVGGRVELDSSQTVEETIVSSNRISARINNKALQIISVKITNEVTQKNYFVGGYLGSDQQTVYFGEVLPKNNLSVKIVYRPLQAGMVTTQQKNIILGKKLPSQNTKVNVTYLPKGIVGDRISLFKDKYGYLNFNVRANNQDFLIRSPIVWDKGSWHRVRASYRMNSGANTDQISLLVDGYTIGNVLFGQNLVFDQYPVVMGSTYHHAEPLKHKISFKDSINYIVLGGSFDDTRHAKALINNFKISNIIRPTFAPFNEPLDPNYSPNLKVVFPVKEDLYTTYLLDIAKLVALNEDFAILKNKKSGLFDFTINIFDLFGIVKSNDRIKQILEILIRTLKPASSRAFISYN